MSSLAGSDIRTTVRMIRETKGLTQQTLADAAGVSLSTVRRLEREPSARFHETTEHQLEYVLGLRRGALEQLRAGGDINDAFESGLLIQIPRSDAYREAPLSEIVVAESYVATIMASGLEEMLTHRYEELALLAAGKLTPGSGEHPYAWSFEWLPWPARAIATPSWLDRFHDSCEQVRSVLQKGEVPRPLRIAEAVALRIAWEYMTAVKINYLFDLRTGEEVDDPFHSEWDSLFDVADPGPLFDQGRAESEWVSEASPLHPGRWWQRLPVVEVT